MRQKRRERHTAPKHCAAAAYWRWQGGSLGSWQEMDMIWLQFRYLRSACTQPSNSWYRPRIPGHKKMVWSTLDRLPTANTSLLNNLSIKIMTNASLPIMIELNVFFNQYILRLFWALPSRFGTTGSISFTALYKIHVQWRGRGGRWERERVSYISVKKKSGSDFPKLKQEYVK